MSDTEVHYLTFDPEEIWNQMMLSHIAAGGDVLYPGDEKEMLLRGVLADITQVFAAVDHALRMQTLRYAVGDYLDLLGETRGCARLAATAATARVTITTRATGQTDRLAAGTAMTADGQAYYELTEDFLLTGWQQTATVEVRATRTGSAGNALLTGAQLQLTAPHTGILSIVAESAASGGDEREEDEAYRARIREAGLQGVTTGPASQYEAAAMAASSEVLDARALRLGAGSVGVYVILAEGAAASVLASVTAALSARDTRPLTDSVSVAQAAAISYTLKAEVQAAPDSTASAALAAAVREYQSWQDNTIGRAFDPFRLMALLYQAGATRVSWGEGSEFDGGDVAYTEIAADERCSGTITLTVSDS